MTIKDIAERHTSQQACMNHLESVRWGDKPECPLCGSERIGRKKEREMIGRWRCYDCKGSFNVLSGTFLHATRIPLRRWFLAIALALNCLQTGDFVVSRDSIPLLLGLPRKQSRYLMRKVCAELENDDSMFHKL